MEALIPCYQVSTCRNLPGDKNTTLTANETHLRYNGDSCITSDKRDGICRPFDQCRTAPEQLRRGEVPVNCGFQGSNPIVCCLKGNESATNETSLGSTEPSRNPGEKAEEWCQNYIKHCSRRRFIAGGEGTSPSEFPHMAAIGYGEENNKKWLCGGTLISMSFVMTAAHCLTTTEAGPARWVLLGTESLISGDGQLYPIIRRITHPGYKPPFKYNDLALLEIGDPIMSVNGSLLIRPACLPTLNVNYTSLKAVATGWGRTGHGDDASPELLKVSLDIFELSICNKTFDVEIRTTNGLSMGIDDTMLCAGVLEGGKDTCQGDSGGPLQSPMRKTCIYEVWGVTSFGKACAFPNSPAVYMRVSAYVPWIESIVWP